MQLAVHACSRSRRAWCKILLHPVVHAVVVTVAARNQRPRWRAPQRFHRLLRLRMQFVWLQETLLSQPKLLRQNRQARQRSESQVSTARNVAGEVRPAVGENAAHLCKKPLQTRRHEPDNLLEPASDTERGSIGKPRQTTVFRITLPTSTLDQLSAALCGVMFKELSSRGRRIGTSGRASIVSN